MQKKLIIYSRELAKHPSESQSWCTKINDVVTNFYVFDFWMVGGVVSHCVLDPWILQMDKYESKHEAAGTIRPIKNAIFYWNTKIDFPPLL